MIKEIVYNRYFENILKLHFRIFEIIKIEELVSHSFHSFLKLDFIMHLSLELKKKVKKNSKKEIVTHCCQHVQHGWNYLCSTF